MIRKLFQLLALTVAIGWQLDAAVAIKGTAISCELGDKSPLFVDVYVFDSARVPHLVGLIKTVESDAFRRDDQDGHLFPQWFTAVMRSVKGSRSLVHTHTDRAGFFRAEIPNIDNVLVFGYANVEDHPFFFEYKKLAINGRLSVDVVLDFGHYCASAK